MNQPTRQAATVATDDSRRPSRASEASAQRQSPRQTPSSANEVLATRYSQLSSRTPHVTSGSYNSPLLCTKVFAEDRLRLSSVRIITGISCVLFAAAAWQVGPHSSSDFTAEAQTAQARTPPLPRNCIPSAHRSRSTTKPRSNSPPPARKSTPPSAAKPSQLSLAAISAALLT